MTFLSAIFCWALPLAAAPVIIHLLHRRQQKVIRWGAMQFLVEATRRRRRIWRLDDWLLMLLRCAVLLALVFALARPLVRASWVGVGPQRDVILVLDVSMSMGREIGAETPWTRLQHHVETLFSRLSSHDTVQVVLAAATPVWQTSEPVPADSRAISTLKDRLTKLSPSHGPGDLFAAMEQSVTTDASPRSQSRLIIVISDLRTYGLPVDGEIAAGRLKSLLAAARTPTAINIIDVGTPEKDSLNVSLDGLEADRVLAGLGERIEITVRITNHGTQRIDASSLAWIVDEDPASISFVEPLEPGQSTSLRMEQTFDDAGLHTMGCRLDVRDELPADNEARLIVEVRTKVPILVVTSTPATDATEAEARYLLAALGKSDTVQPAASLTTFFEPTLVDVRELERVTLSDYLGVVFLDLAELSEATVERLTQFVRAGGGLWLAAGVETDPASFNKTFSASDDGLSPVNLGFAVGDDTQDQDFATLHPPSTAHPATALLGDTARLDIHEARLFRRWTLTPRRPGDKLAILLETGRGEPVAVERFLGRGRVIVQGFPLSRAWSNLPLCQLYVPYVQEWLRYLVQPASGLRNLAINEPLVLRRPMDSPELPATLHGPLIDPLPLVPDRDQGELAYRYFETVFPGEYMLSWPGDEPPAKFVVQRDPAESDLQAWPAEQQAFWRKNRGVQFSDDPLDWPTQVAVKPAQVPIWSGCLLALMAMIAVELLALCWFAWRKSVIAHIPTAAGA